MPLDGMKPFFIERGIGMKCRIIHEGKNRIRVRFLIGRMTIDQADIAEAYFKRQDEVVDVAVYERTGDVTVTYTDGKRASVIEKFAYFSYDRYRKLLPAHSSRALSHEYEDRMAGVIGFHLVKKLFIPAPISTVLTVISGIGYIAKGLKCLFRGRLEVPVLDATAITASMLTGDFSTASSIMFLLKIGDLLEEWTHKKSVEDLAGAMSLNVDKVWIRTAGGQEVLVPISDVNEGDLCIVRAGSMIPLDGTVIEGEASVNQASMTGESLPVSKSEGAAVFAGTVVEDGECVIRVTQSSGNGKYDRIVHMIEDSEKLKSGTESKAEHLADKLVPWSLGGTALTWLITRNVTKAMSILMVDYSCALKLTMPLSVLSAMKEASSYNISVKGGKFMEAVAEADTIVFDKTGTLTAATPHVADVVAFDGNDPDELLRVAACMEEHFPHSMAKAVVRKAAQKGLDHDAKEMHSEVEYVVAHGIASTVNGKRAVIGSYHFVFEDEKVPLTPENDAIIHDIPKQYSRLFLALGGKLCGVICIEDPIKPEVPGIMKKLHDMGIKRVVMMTGDSRHAAEAVAEKAGVDAFYAEVLPEDKAKFVKQEHEAGRKVIMVGDGINDSPALSEADAGIAISDGAAIAVEIADITISGNDLNSIIALRKLSSLLMKRINGNYRRIMFVNTALILLGVFGILPPATTALLHNGSTILFGLGSMTKLIEK